MTAVTTGVGSVVSGVAALGGRKGREGKEESRFVGERGGIYIPEKAIILYTVNLCARSAHPLPLITIRSHVVICASRSRILACRNRATFSAGVSAGGALPVAAFLGFTGGGGCRAFGLYRVLGLDLGVVDVVDAEGEARVMGVGLA